MASLGVVPWFEQASLLPAEDALDLVERFSDRPAGIKIAVPRLPRLANFDDLDPLAAEPDVNVTLIEPGAPLPGDADLIILPGSKATLADLAAFRAAGWDIDLHAHIRRGGLVLGLCGGFQMLGQIIADPDGIEGPATSAEGLGWLEMTTVLTGEKSLVEAEGHECRSGLAIRGYEMHIGRTSGPALARSFLRLSQHGGSDGRPEGAVSADGRIMGCYVHGLFASDSYRQAFLGRLRERSDTGLRYEQLVEATLDKLADHLEQHLDVEELQQIAGCKIP
jgi:adenosylcobyric acid synthase